MSSPSRTHSYANLCVGIVGGGFVGKATSGFACSTTKVRIYDLQPHLRYPDDVCMEDMYDCDVVFVCVPTPMSKVDGSCHTEIVKRVVRDLQQRGTKHIVIRSTVPIGTSESLGTHFMPEFLTEKNWATDFKTCEHWVVGVNEASSNPDDFRKVMSTLVASAKCDGRIDHDTLGFCSTGEAECIKYFRNCFLATKVAFCNEVYQLCQHKHLSYDTVVQLASTDRRIGSSHTMVPGHDGRRGFGGTCFPKDLASLIHQYKSDGVPCPVLSAAQLRNTTFDRPEKDWESDTGRAVV